MFKLISVIALLISATTAQAHVQTGTFSGTDQNGQACKFTVVKEWFVDNRHHPLNERLLIQGVEIKNQELPVAEWNVGHPSVTNVEKGLVRFNHDFFQEILATSTGAATLIILKDKEESPEGHAPTGFIYINDNYRTPIESVKVTCTVK